MAKRRCAPPPPYTPPTPGKSPQALRFPWIHCIYLLYDVTAMAFKMCFTYAGPVFGIILDSWYTQETYLR